MNNIKVIPYLMRHWGSIHILPVLEISITYSIPTIILMWWIFRLDIVIYHQLPDWFMKYVWGFLHLDWLAKYIDEE